jgi:hypothetical protein
MGPEEKKPEDQRVEGQAGTAAEGAAGSGSQPGSGATAGDPLAGRVSAVAGEVPAGIGRVEPETAEAKPAEPAPPEPAPARAAPYEPVRSAAAEPTPTAGAPWSERREAEPERPAPAAPPPPPPPAAAATEHRGGGGRGFLAGILGSLLILGLAGAAAFFTRDLWVPRLAASVAPASASAEQEGTGVALAALRSDADALKADVAELKSQAGARDERLSALEARVDERGRGPEPQPAADAGEAQPVAAAQPPVPDLSEPVAELDQRLGRLEEEIQKLAGMEGEIQRLSGMEQGLAGVQSAVSEVQTAVDRAEQQASQPAATVLAINQLGDALGRSGGYARQLEAVRVIAGENANLAEPLDRLEQWAGAGLSTLGQLQGEFPAVAQRVARTDYQSGGEGWLDDVTNRLTSLVTVRRVGDGALASGGTDAALVQADTALKSGNLAGAVQALEGLQGQAADAASDWLTKARDRVAAEKALADLRLAAIAQLDAARG